MNDIFTVNDLLDHFSIYPDTIYCFNETDNSEFTVNLATLSLGGARYYDSDLFNKFIEEYGSCFLTSWKYTIKDTLVISIKK